MILHHSLGHPTRWSVRAALTGCTLLALSLQAYALSRSSTMAEWSAASAAEQRDLLEQLGPALTSSFKTDEDEILACVSLAAQGSAHANLTVIEIAKACAEAVKPSSGKDPSQGI